MTTTSAQVSANDGDWHSTLREWNATDADFPQLCVHELFEWELRDRSRGGDALAIMAAGSQITYRELSRKSEQISNYLKSLGLTGCGRVAVHLRDTPEMVAAMLGILKAGAAYVPVDPADPEDRIRHILSDAGVQFVVTGCDSNRTNFPAGVRCVTIDDSWTSTSHEPGPPRPSDPAAPAYLIYTSGSTGRPKGVEMGHRSLTNLLTWHARTRPGTCALRTLQFCNITFDFSFHEIFSTLCFGGTLFLADEHVRRNPFALAEFVAQHGIERIFLPVTALRQLAEAMHARPRLLPVREVITTGERLTLTPGLIEFFRQTGARLHNHYGATEFQDATCHTLAGDPSEWPPVVPIGRPISNVQVYVLDEQLNLLPPGVPGELYIGGAGLARGYAALPELTAEKFISNPFGEGRLYRTGDIGRFEPGGPLEHLGRSDEQIKLQGVRVEPAEIETRLTGHPSVGQAVVRVQHVAGQDRLVAYVVLRNGADGDSIGTRLHSYLRTRLPRDILPAAYVVLGEIPVTSSGKCDTRLLPVPAAVDRLIESPIVSPRSDIERSLAAIWHEVLQVDAVGIHDNFFDVGGTSLHIVAVHQKISDRLGIAVSFIDLFRYPTIHSLARYAARALRPATANRHAPARKMRPGDSSGIAIIGMSGRFPGAESVELFWNNLARGVESIQALSVDEIQQTDPALLGSPDYVKAAAPLADIGFFDAAFFNIAEKEAAIMDPQQRVILECAWEAFENAGYAPLTFAGEVAVFAGSSISTYLVNNLNPHFGFTGGRPFVEADTLQLQLKLGNDRNYLPARISYKLNLKGASVNVQTACSTSLVAVHLACRSLEAGECEMALAGGISIIVPQRGGYLFEEGMIRSRDGHCRAFDARASGTVFGNGGGLVVLKRLPDAMADGDNILAVIRGSAVNNDGWDKVGFTALSVNRQSDLIEDALAAAEIDPQSITYVETHGTATALGDPIEIAALTQAFRNSSGRALRAGYCAVGSVKTNIGHLDEAAGIAGLIKTTLALQHKALPPSLHFTTPNPQIDFANSPFFVNQALTDWPGEDGPRRAGVSSFGMGGTNCHLILEEAAVRARSGADARAHILPISARSEAALRALITRYIEYLAKADNIALGDLCFTASTGRSHFEHRAVVIADSIAGMRAGLEERLRRPPGGALPTHSSRKVAFVLGGEGWHDARMRRELYDSEPVFHAAIDECDALLQERLGAPLAACLFGDNSAMPGMEQGLFAGAALFAVEYALVQLWGSYGVVPDVVIGHGAGELLSAFIAGSVSLSDGLMLAASRGGVMHSAGMDDVLVSSADPMRKDFAQRAAASDAELFLEISPQPTLSEDVLPKGKPVWVTTLRPDSDRRQLLHAAGDLYVAGLPIDWQGIFHGAYRRAALPTYPFERQRHWIEGPRSEPQAAAEPMTHPLLGAPIELADSDEIRFQRRLGPGNVSWLQDHKVFQSVVMPGVAYLEMAFAAGKAAYGTSSIAVQDFVIHRAMEFSSDRVVQALVRPGGSGSAKFEIYSRTVETGGGEGQKPPWMLHASATLSRAGAVAVASPTLADVRRELPDEIAVASIYEREHSRQIDLGPHFQVTEQIWAAGLTCLSKFRLREDLLGEAAAHQMHPVLLEAGFLALTVTYPEKHGPRSYIPAGIEQVRLFSHGEREGWCHARLRTPEGEDPHTLRADIRFLSMDGREVLRMEGVVLQCASREAMLARSDSALKDLLYETVWERCDLDGPVRGRDGRNWLILSDTGLGPALVREVRAPGGACTLVFPENGDAAAGPHAGAKWIDAANVQALERLLDSSPPFDIVVTTWTSEARGRVEPYSESLTGCTRLLALVQALARRRQSSCRLYVVSRGAQGAAGTHVTDPARSALWGMAAVISTEYPDIGCVRIDLDPAMRPEHQAAFLRDEIAACAGSGVEEQVAFRAGARYVARLKRRVPVMPIRTRMDAASAGTCLITGGLGGIGVEIARAVLKSGIRDIAVLTRPGANPARAAQIRKLEGSGARIAIFEADVCDERQVAGVIENIRTSTALQPLRGVIHLAGILDDGILRLQTAERFARVMGPKVAGGWNLHRLTMPFQLDFFILFSSVASTMGAAGQANYAAANAFLDGLASYRRALGLPALSIQWGSWAGTGMSAEVHLEERFQRSGEGMLSKQSACEAFYELLPRSPASHCVAVLPINWSRLLATGSAVPRFLSAVHGAAPNEASSPEGFRRQLETAAAGERRALLEAHVREQLQRILGEDLVLEPRAGFFALGMDSLTSLELRNNLQGTLACRLPQTLAFDYPNLNALVDYLYGEVLHPGEPEVQRASSPVVQDSERDIAERLAKKLGMKIVSDE